MPFGHANTKAAAALAKCGHGSDMKMIMQSSRSHGAGMTEVDEMDWTYLDAWHHCALNRVPEPEILTWILQTPGGRVHWTMLGNFWFEHHDDLVLFQLTWA